MSNAEDSNTPELAEALRSHIERRAHSTMSPGSEFESIADVANILTELSATLPEDLNSRIHLLQLPVEIQQKILEHVPDPLSTTHYKLRLSWHSNAMDTSMLRPVLQTCRQLRRIALSHVFLWKTISPTQAFSLPSILLRKSCDVPLIAVIDGSWGDEPEVFKLGSLDKVDAHRMQELHLFDLNVPYLRDDITAKIHEYFEAGLPLLESLSICRVSTRDEGENISTNECPFPLDDVPRLRRMMLHAVTFIPTNEFPHLTHLALSDIDNSHPHIETAHLLSRCPNLESLVIWYPHIGSRPPPLNVPDDFPHSLTLNRLHRVTLKLPQFHANTIDFYLSFFPQGDSTPQPTALQILDLNIRDDASALSDVLPRITKAEASYLSLALHPYAECYRYLSISAAGPKGTFHISTECFQGMIAEPQAESDVSPKMFLDSVLPSCTHLHAVREVWVTAMPTPPPFRDAVEHFRSTIAALPALDTVVLLVTAVGAHGQLEVDLGLCPSAHDPGFASPNLKTLRIVHGDERLTGSGPVEKVRLTSLLDQVRTGAYGYFENVVLETTPRLVVDGEDLARLRACFKNVTFQHVHSMPTMPLPEYCTEPYAGPGGSSTWYGSLW